MAKFKIIVSDPESGTSKVVELEEARAAHSSAENSAKSLDGAIVDLPAQKVNIMGGSDKDGVPMRGNVHGGVRRAVVLSGGAGFKPKRKAKENAKPSAEASITDEIAQINMKILKASRRKTAEAKPTPKTQSASTSLSISRMLKTYKLPKYLSFNSSGLCLRRRTI